MLRSMSRRRGRREGERTRDEEGTKREEGKREEKRIKGSRHALEGVGVGLLTLSRLVAVCC
jgi:hypothetical protein